MSKKEVTIITGFFDIGRDKFKGEFARKNDKYIEYFKFWARIKNKMVVYTDTDTAKEVKKIRGEFGLLDKTKIVIVDDYSAIEPQLLERMEMVSKSEDFLKYRYMPNPADNNAKYDYIMLLKSWCMQDAVKQGLADGLLVWLDFGTNHGGRVFPKAEEFNYKLEVDLPDDKITFFSVKEDDNVPIFRVVQSYEAYIMGFIIYAPANLTSTLWEDAKRAMNSLLDVGFIDDDQTIMLMMARNHKDRYNVIESDWFMPLKQYGCEHLTVKKDKHKIALKDRLLRGYRINKRNRKCIKNLKSMFLK